MTPTRKEASGRMTREQKADTSLWDFGTREGATAGKVLDQMKQAGFTVEEIRAAIERMNG